MYGGGGGVICMGRWQPAAAAVMGNATASLYGDIKLARRFLCVWSVFLKKVTTPSYTYASATQKCRAYRSGVFCSFS